MMNDENGATANGRRRTARGKRRTTNGMTASGEPCGVAGERSARGVGVWWAGRNFCFFLLGFGALRGL